MANSGTDRRDPSPPRAGLCPPSRKSAGCSHSYLTNEWLTFRQPKEDDANRSRWPLAPEWRQIQQASLVSRRVGAERIARARRRASIARLLPGLTGYLASLAAASAPRTSTTRSPRPSPTSVTTRP